MIGQLNANKILQIWRSGFLDRELEEGYDPNNYFALPKPAMEFLVGLCRSVGVTRVFEFGSGQSTIVLLREGFTVASLEYTDHWMDETRKQLNGDYRQHTPLVCPLKPRWCGLIPMMGWEVDSELRNHLESADLILVDSPSGPFREVALCSALIYAPAPTLVVIDDINIDTICRFCRKIAATNPSLLYKEVKCGHRFGVFAKLDDKSPLAIRHSPLEFVKGWRRFVKMKNDHLVICP